MSKPSAGTTASASASASTPAPAAPKRVRKKKPDLDLSLSDEARLDAVLREAGIGLTSNVLTATDRMAWEAARVKPELPSLVNVDLNAADGDIPFFDAELLASRDLSDPFQSATALTEKELHRRRHKRETRLLHLYQSQLANLSSKLVALTSEAVAGRFARRSLGLGTRSTRGTPTPSGRSRTGSASSSSSSSSSSSAASLSSTIGGSSSEERPVVDTADETARRVLVAGATRHRYHLRRFDAVGVRSTRLASAHCIFSSGDAQATCSAATLPFSGYCLEHILNDPNQCLYVPCAAPTTISCRIPVLAYMRGPFCAKHTHFLYTTTTTTTSTTTTTTTTTTTAEASSSGKDAKPGQKE